MEEERCRAGVEMGLNSKELAIPSQVHSNIVKIINRPGYVDKCDGLITNENNVVLSIQIADCVPIFIYSPDIRAIGLIHSGWKGTANEISVHAVKKLTDELGATPEKMLIFLGPSVQPCCYTVQDDVAYQFQPEFYKRNSMGFALDLIRANIVQLASMGVPEDQIRKTDICSCCDETMFHSYRRDGHKVGRNFCFLKLSQGKI